MICRHGILETARHNDEGLLACEKDGFSSECFVELYAVGDDAYHHGGAFGVLEVVEAAFSGGDDLPQDAVDGVPRPQ